MCNWLRCADERAHELSVDLGRKFSGIEPTSNQEGCCVFGLVHPGRLDGRFYESDLAKQSQEFPLLERTRDAALRDPKPRPA